MATEIPHRPTCTQGTSEVTFAKWHLRTRPMELTFHGQDLPHNKDTFFWVVPGVAVSLVLTCAVLCFCLFWHFFSNGLGNLRCSGTSFFNQTTDSPSVGIQLNLNSSNTDCSFTMANSNSFLSPLENSSARLRKLICGDFFLFYHRGDSNDYTQHTIIV